MLNNRLRDRCKVNTNIKADTFVGINVTGDDISINFPLGFRIHEGEKGLRRDIMLLMNVLSRNTDKKDSQIDNAKGETSISLPIQAYLHVIADYYSRGYYKESEKINKVSQCGKINWGKTIKTQKAFISNNDIYYLTFATQKNDIREKELITLIHEYCVYESFEKLGWLFTTFMPMRPRIKCNPKLFKKVVKGKMLETFNDRNRELFKALLSIISYMGPEDSTRDYKYGTSRFEYIWESMIDKVYGIQDKADYFPATRWNIGEEVYENSYLKPDTIMIANGKVYVVDAKYYKYGWTKAPEHLPESESINKQITYGEYIANSDKFKDASGTSPTVYNAFLMPYDSHKEAFKSNGQLCYVGKATSDWKMADGRNPYEEVVGILIDIKTIMQDYNHNSNRISELAEMIEKHVKQER